MRQTISVSHAAPEDNDFTRWLLLQFIGLGNCDFSHIFQFEFL